MAGVVAAERELDRFARAVGIPTDAKQWLENALDPCHDRLTKLTGYPDNNQSASCVQRVKQAINITAPTSVITSGSTWDCLILDTPFETANNLTNYQSQPGGSNAITSNTMIQTPANLNLGSWGGLQVVAIKSGSPTSAQFSFNTIAAGITAGTATSNSYVIDPTYQAGPARIITKGFEVCNVTADLTAQGSVACFRQPVQDFEDASTFQLFINNPITALATCSVLPVPGPPTSLNTSMLLAGTRQWKAKDGAYCTGVLNTDRLPVQDFNFVQPLLYQNDSGVNTIIEGPGIIPSSATIPASPPVALNTVNRQFWSNFDQYGCIFSGLSATSSLQLTRIVDVERFPTEQQKDLAVLAVPSTEFSIEAQEAYSRITQDLPVGVPFKENGLGDWFMGAVSKVRDVVMPTIRAAAKTNPMMKSLVGVHDLITDQKKGKGKGKGGGKNSGKGFLAPSGGNGGKVNPKRGGKLTIRVPRENHGKITMVK